MNNITELNHLQTIAKNLDFSLRVKQTKSVLVVSDQEKEGKSTFIRECAPLLCELYKRKVLVFDCQIERQQHLEKTFSPTSINHQSIRETSVKGLDYIHAEDLLFLETLPQPEKSSGLVAYFNEISKAYDLVLINMKTLKRAEKTVLPALPIDGAIVVRSKKTLDSEKRPITTELRDREIPIIGIVMNEGGANG